jgi:predicted ATP-grasp superfamily ATP-dependent carboligase
LKVFAFDYMSGADLMHRQLPPSLRHQGEIMLRALRADLLALPGVDVITMDDPWLPLMPPDSSASPLAHGSALMSGRQFARRFNACMQMADAVWPVAPESGGILERLSRKVLQRKRLLLGSTPDAVRLASSKLLTSRVLADAGIAVAPTYTPADPLPAKAGAWVVKPDASAGCVDTWLFGSPLRALAWIGGNPDSHYILQPFIPGKLGSLSLLCCDGAVRVLSCNEQRIAVRDNQFHFLGSTVNSMSDASGELGRLARQVAAAIPGLWGYVGVDFVRTERGVVVLGINPRMTTSHAGLHAAIGCNPAGLVLGLLAGPDGMFRSVFKPIAVSVDVEAFGTA